MYGTHSNCQQYSLETEKSSEGPTSKRSNLLDDTKSNPE